MQIWKISRVVICVSPQFSRDFVDAFKVIACNDINGILIKIAIVILLRKIMSAIMISTRWQWSPGRVKSRVIKVAADDLCSETETSVNEKFRALRKWWRLHSRDRISVRVLLLGELHRCRWDSFRETRVRRQYPLTKMGCKGLRGPLRSSSRGRIRRSAVCQGYSGLYLKSQALDFVKRIWE